MDEETQDTTESTDSDSSTPDFSEQFTDLSNRLDQITARLPEQQEEAEHDPADLLLSEDDDYEPYSDDELEADDDQGYETPNDPRLDRIENHLLEREQERIVGDLQALGEKYPDMREQIPQIRAKLDQITDDPAMRANPNLVENVYLALKAQADADAETPAEEARSRGARIETGASAGAPTEPDPDAAFIDAFGSGREESIF